MLDKFDKENLKDVKEVIKTAKLQGFSNVKIMTTYNVARELLKLGFSVSTEVVYKSDKFGFVERDISWG